MRASRTACGIIAEGTFRIAKAALSLHFRATFCAALLLLAAPSFAQSKPQSLPSSTEIPEAEHHDISKVDPAPPGSVIAVPLPEKQRRQLRKYDIPELVGARQALGSQLINGELPKPMFDYRVTNAAIDQRVSFFDGGLVVLWMSGAGGLMRKKVLLPPEAVSAYAKAVPVDVIARIAGQDVTPPRNGRSSLLRVYRADGSHVEVAFDPVGGIPKELADAVRPLEDLVRVMSEDRTVTNTVAGYDPAVGDELVGDDRKTWRVERIIAESGVVQLHCIGEPTVIYVAKKDLYNYFVGKKASAQ